MLELPALGKHMGFTPHSFIIIGMMMMMMMPVLMIIIMVMIVIMVMIIVMVIIFVSVLMKTMRMGNAKVMEEVINSIVIRYSGGHRQCEGRKSSYDKIFQHILPLINNSATRAHP